jgi:cation diffusion facilitator CzcD-associated flavoprotein CzcO
MPDPVIVIGGSLAGLAAAARLAKAGHAVELYERSDELGGTWARTSSRAVSRSTMRRRSSASRHHGVTCSERVGGRWKPSLAGWATPWSRPGRRP